ncbi:MAG: hypothetical protein AAF594_06340 [Bacteroidota bacterium]
MASILIYLVLAIIFVSLLMMIGFGLRNSGTFLQQGKLALAAFALPVIILVVAFAVSQDWTSAFVMAAVFTALSGFLALVISGVRSFFS